MEDSAGRILKYGRSQNYPNASRDLRKNPQLEAVNGVHSISQ